MTPFSYLADYVPFRKELKLRVDGNWGIVSNGQDFQIEYLNESALVIFQLIDGEKSVSEIAECFVKDVDISRDIFEKDLIEMLRGFQWKKLIGLKQKA